MSHTSGGLLCVALRLARLGKRKEREKEVSSAWLRLSAAQTKRQGGSRDFPSVTASAFEGRQQTFRAFNPHRRSETQVKVAGKVWPDLVLGVCS